MQDPHGEFSGAEGASGEVSGRSWTESTEGRASEAASEVGRRARRAQAEVAETLRDAKEKVSVAYDRTADTAARAYRGARGYAQENPGVAAAVTFAAGMGVGMMMATRNGMRAYRRGIIPVVAIALAQAVLDVLDEGH